jgi:hypothetical protein
LNELDVVRDGGNRCQCGDESVVCRDRARVESNGKSDVHRVVNGLGRGGRKRMGVVRGKWRSCGRERGEVVIGSIGALGRACWILPID